MAAVTGRFSRLREPRLAAAAAILAVVAIAGLVAGIAALAGPDEPRDSSSSETSESTSPTSTSASTPTADTVLSRSSVIVPMRTGRGDDIDLFVIDRDEADKQLAYAGIQRFPSVSQDRRLLHFATLGTNGEWKHRLLTSTGSEPMVDHQPRNLVCRGNLAWPADLPGRVAMLCGRGVIPSIEPTPSNEPTPTTGSPSPTLPPPSSSPAPTHPTSTRPTSQAPTSTPTPSPTPSPTLAPTPTPTPSGPPTGAVAHDPARGSAVALAAIRGMPVVASGFAGVAAIAAPPTATIYRAHVDASGHVDGRSLTRTKRFPTTGFDSVSLLVSGGVVAGRSGTAAGLYYLPEGPEATVQQLTSGPDLDPDGSPRRRDDRVVFSRDGDLYLVAVDDRPIRCSGEERHEGTRTLCRLTSGAAIDVAPTWSWDARWIAFGEVGNVRKGRPREALRVAPRRRPGVRTRPRSRARGCADVVRLRPIRYPQRSAPSGTCTCTMTRAADPPTPACAVGCWCYTPSDIGGVRHARAPVRRRGSRPSTEGHPHRGTRQRPLGRAAVEGRSDVLGETGLMGLQRAAGNSAVSSMVEDEPSPVHDVDQLGRPPLEPDVRTDMEGRLGHDFGDVRVHDDSAAHRSAQSVNAHAYTVGSNVVFQRDKYDPRLRRRPDDARPRADPRRPAAQRPGRRHPDARRHQGQRPSDRFEREAAANAERVMAAPAPAEPAPPAPAPARRSSARSRRASRAARRRARGGGRGDRPGRFVQRDAAPEEEEEKPEE